jgi:small subunit ribosomal protein S6
MTSTLSRVRGPGGRPPGPEGGEPRVRPYEVMMIFDIGAEPPAIQGVVERVLETVQTHGGTPGAVDRWGRRPFAYEVKHRREGYYVLVEFGGEVRTVHELDRVLSLADEVLRHKVVRVPEKAVKRAGASSPEGRKQNSGGVGTRSAGARSAAAADPVDQTAG